MLNFSLMKYSVIIILFFPLLVLSQGNDSLFKPKYSAIINSNDRKEILNLCSREAPRNVSGFWNLSETDIKILEDNFKKIIPLKIKNRCFLAEMPDIRNYAFQYTGVLINGDKFIYLNAFEVNITKEYKDWKTKPLIPCDGGNLFWGGLFNLDNAEFSELSTNGDKGCDNKNWHLNYD